MTTNASKRLTGLLSAQSGGKWFRFGLLTFGVVVLVTILFLWASWWAFAPPALEPTDLLLLEPESVLRVEAAARAGDIMAQSTLGAAYLDESRHLPRDVTKAIYWLRKVADRDESEFERIKTRMQLILEERTYEIDPQKGRELDLAYLDLVATKLTFEAAFIGLIRIYLGHYGDSHADVELALKYMRQGANYGFPSMQRTLGIVTQLGWLGVPKNEIQGTLLLSQAAAQGDRIARALVSRPMQRPLIPTAQ